MRLKEFNPIVLQEYQNSMPQIRFSSNGNIYINAAAVDLMSGTKCNSIIFHQDQDHISDWFISESEKGFNLRKYNGNKTMYFISKKLRSKVLESIGCKEKSVAFRIMPKTVIDGIMMYKLIKL